MALVATFGDTNAFNIKIFDMSGGGYYAILCDGATQIFQRRNASGGQDLALWNGAVHQNVKDHFLSYSYDSATKILTLSGAVDTFNSITYTRQEVYKFISAYVVQDIYTIVSNVDNGEISATNWNFYLTPPHAIIDIDNANIGDATPLTPLGYGIQLTTGGSYYGVIADNNHTNLNTNRKRSLASQSAIAVIWPSDSNHMILSAALNNRTYTMSQFFFKSTNTFYDFMLQAQLAIVSAKDYIGTLWEKICQVTGYLNIALRDNLQEPKVLASTFYPNATLMRDSFWQSFLLPDDIEQDIITQFEDNQLPSGQIPTYVHTNGTSLKFYQDEATLMYMIRAYYDREVRGLTINQAVLVKALAYINLQVVNNQYQMDATDGARIKMWNDSYFFTAGTYNAYTQGLYCVALLCATRLGLSLGASQFNDAVAQYQALYDPDLTFIRFVSNKDYMAPDVLVGEALSIWLFDMKLLTDISVRNTLKAIEQYAMTPAGAKNICTKTGDYLLPAEFSSPFAGGDYQNGGSWFLYEYLAWFAGIFHFYENAQSLLNTRIDLELQTDPVSHEYVVASILVANYLSETATRHVYGWNIASASILPIVVVSQGAYAFKLKEKF